MNAAEEPVPDALKKVRVLHLHHMKAPPINGCRWCGRIRAGHSSGFEIFQDHVAPIPPSRARDWHHWEAPSTAQVWARLAAHEGHQREAKDSQRLDP